MTGTIVNAAAVLAGSALGLAVGKHLPDRAREIVLHGLGLASLAIGLLLLDIKQIRVANLLPALILAPILASYF